MKPFFQFDTEESKKSLLSRARNAALTALRQYDLDWNCIRFLQLSDTVTFKIETESSSGYLLRIHSERMNKDELMSELVYLHALRNIEGVRVPAGVQSRNGSYVWECETEPGYRSPCVSLMTWVEGEHASGDFTDRQVYSMGAMMGKLHEASARFVAPHHFVRPHWGSQNFRNHTRKLERYYPRFLTSTAWSLYQAAMEKIERQLESLPRTERNYGLIHADLHSGNIVFNDDQPSPIDFGRCGYGYFLYDMAGALLGLSPRQRQLLIQGYESVRNLDGDYAAQLEGFFIMFMIENYCHHCSDPEEIPNLISEQKYAQAYINEYLSDQSFLFKKIPPVEMK